MRVADHSLNSATAALRAGGGGFQSLRSCHSWRASLEIVAALTLQPRAIKRKGFPMLVAPRDRPRVAGAALALQNHRLWRGRRLDGLTPRYAQRSTSARLDGSTRARPIVRRLGARRWRRRDGSTLDTRSLDGSTLDTRKPLDGSTRAALEGRSLDGLTWGEARCARRSTARWSRLDGSTGEETARRSTRAALDGSIA